MKLKAENKNETKGRRRNRNEMELHIGSSMYIHVFSSQLKNMGTSRAAAV